MRLTSFANVVSVLRAGNSKPNSESPGERTLGRASRDGGLAEDAKHKAVRTAEAAQGTHRQRPQAGSAPVILQAALLENANSRRMKLY